MLYVLHIFGWLLSLSLSALLIYLAVELLVGLIGRNKVDLDAVPSKWTGAILVPAHNEALGIAETVAHLFSVAPKYRVVVVADNCTDDTASLAQLAGAEAIVRSDILQRGKGFALAYGRDYLAKAPPDAVIVIDADCRLAEGSADILIDRAVQGQQPVQGVNLLVPGLIASPLASISNFAMLIKNLVRARGLCLMSGGTLLFGTGMAFPWKLFESLDLANSHTVEDLELGLVLARQGVKVSFEDRALVTSPAASATDNKDQRSRWEHGFLQAAFRNGIPLVVSGIKERSLHLAMIGAHMLVPPLAMLATLSLSASLLLGMIYYFFGYLGPLLLLSICLAFTAALILLAWWKEGRDVLSTRSLLLVPFYIFWKIPIYIRFFTSRQTEWNRTHREGEH